MPTRNSSAKWEGGLKGGKGEYGGESGMSGRYSFGSRFEEAGGSNPEELLGAALAACYSMALSANLEKSGKNPGHVESSVATSFGKVGEGFQVTGMKLTVRASVPDASDEEFQTAAQAAKEGCPVSQALKGNFPIELDAKLE